MLHPYVPFKPQQSLSPDASTDISAFLEGVQTVSSDTFGERDLIGLQSQASYFLGHYGSNQETADFNNINDITGLQNQATSLLRQLGVTPATSDDSTTASDITAPLNTGPPSTGSETSTDMIRRLEIRREMLLVEMQLLELRKK
jgi:hypothetical protein